MAENTNVTEVKAKKAKAPKDPYLLTEKTMMVLEEIRSMSGDFTATDIAKNLEMKPIAVNALINALVRRNLVHRTEPVTVELEDGKTAEVKFIVLDEEGRSELYHC